MTIKEAIAKLSKEDQKHIMDAFNNVEPHYIIFDNDCFVGVNVVGLPHLDIQETHGYWSIGKVK